MKKVLYGTTALIAAGAFAATASAEPIELSIGGKQEMYFLAGDSNDNNGETWASTGMYTDTELYFTGQTTLDNGITVQAIIQLEAEDRMDRNADEQAIILSGGFGAMQIGQRQSYVGMMQYVGPSVGGPFGANEIRDWNWANFTNASSSQHFNYYTDDDLSVSYVTPSFFGFTLAGAYAPDSSNNDDSVFEEWNTTGSSYKDLLQVGAAFDNEFSGVGIHADVTYQYFFGAAQSETLIDLTAGQVTDLATQLGVADPGQAIEVTATANNPDRSLLRGGLSVSYMGFEVGGSYGQWNFENTNDSVDSWSAGASYSNGPYAVAFEYYGSSEDIGANTDAHSFAFSGRYILGPGINLGAAVFHGDEELDGNNNDRETTGVVLGIGLAF
ncbi:porin [Rhodospira trueperi]|uniref:Outer membrane protein OmpU n=1 Tax=Rhodospira trueperi TaxID=69960 RepID=A0A1G7AXA3_9PROT|nr:porin [Rhodospira trueperi]SDE18586.1 outer membrane protein OmpU [Rhodospira trueperi]